MSSSDCTLGSWCVGNRSLARLGVRCWDYCAILVVALSLAILMILLGRLRLVSFGAGLDSSLVQAFGGSLNVSS